MNNNNNNNNKSNWGTTDKIRDCEEEIHNLNADRWAASHPDDYHMECKEKFLGGKTKEEIDKIYDDAYQIEKLKHNEYVEEFKNIKHSEQDHINNSSKKTPEQKQEGRDILTQEITQHTNESNNIFFHQISVLDEEKERRYTDLDIPLSDNEDSGENNDGGMGFSSGENPESSSPNTDFGDYNPSMIFLDFIINILKGLGGDDDYFD